MKIVTIDGNNLTIEDVINVARYNYRVELTEEAVEKVKRSRQYVDQIVEKEEIVYGITTGFGKFSDTVISKEDTKKLQRNLIVSHACSVGRPLDEEIVRAVMLLRANALAKGFSGIRLKTLNILIDMLNKGVHPVIPEKGSLGASGDLAPLAHMVLVMIGEGEAFYKGNRVSGKEAMESANIQTVELTSKEGLALINGTQIMTAIAALTVYDAKNLLKLADISAALTLEGLKGIITAFDERVHKVRNHRGQMKVASNIKRLCKSSELITKQGELRVQDAYTLRCIPQIHGASKDAVEYVINVINTEINSATDNPLVFEEDRKVISGGNFHGQPVALAMDFLSIALAEIANVSERRIERLVNPQLSKLPAFLAKNGGLNSGFMIAQYSAASLVSENKVLCHPASVDSIPSSANQEDHVSMGTIAARKAKEVLYNTTNVLAIELMTAAQAIDFQSNKTLGKGTKTAYEVIRNHVSFIEEDRIMYKNINICYDLIKSGIILKEVEERIGKLS
ncbi:histidine ammonia-lyase [Caldisalinibacter kiritimatiensis]|uniref:Histidine ammonia-lyase n=1 Tax=Caldisalinibacter kiritimatiensis TaxID=1304284 RepID=R1CSM9_9FIRM|nr:histidine ammonia-lyase [Caldisalinibacter kiritimatiensis]EOD01666.1 Histidine ammonia-lyase [Caldisalinibacter kiritimatiensis]